MFYNDKEGLDGLQGKNQAHRYMFFNINIFFFFFFFTTMTPSTHEPASAHPTPLTCKLKPGVRVFIPNSTLLARKHELRVGFPSPIINPEGQCTHQHRPTAANEGQHRPIKAHSSQWRPTQAYSSQCRPMQAPTAANDRLQPMKANMDPQRPMMLAQQPTMRWRPACCKSLALFSWWGVLYCLYILNMYFILVIFSGIYIFTLPDNKLNNPKRNWGDTHCTSCSDKLTKKNSPSPLRRVWMCRVLASIAEDM